MTQSVQNRRWLVRTAPEGVVLDPSRYPPLIARLLALRGVRDDAQARAFTHPNGVSANPALIPGVPHAIERILRAIDSGERIAVYGDYDVDGVTATAILSEGLRELGGDTITHIPDRFTDGYGLTRAGLRAMSAQGAGLVISVDCGINANDEIEYAAELGLGVVVLDHHEPPPVLPNADAIVDPKLGGGPAEYDGLASCGLAYTVLRTLFEATNTPLDHARYLDLVALGTVADMVPLLGENRRLVRAGLKALRTSGRPGLQALLRMARVDVETLDAEAISFRLAPRLNAAGRIEHAALALELLTTADPGRAEELARTLHELNGQRQRMTEEALALARALADADGEGSPLIIVGHEHIAQGIVGLVAGKLVEERYRPAIVYERGAEICRGSMRTIRELDVVRCLTQANSLMERWGGHSQAGGFTIQTARLSQFKEILSEWTTRELEGLDLRPAYEADLEAPLALLRGPELRWLGYFQPCGQENPAPMFVSRRVPVIASRTVGAEGRHLRLKLRDGVATWDAIGFNLGHAMPRPGTRIDILYTIAEDRRGGLELVLKDFAPAD